MNYYIVKIPCSGAWLREPYQGASLDRNQAWPYPEDHRHLHAVVYQMRTQGLGKLRLRQVMPAEDALESTLALEYVVCPDCKGGGTIESFGGMRLVGAGVGAFVCKRCQGKGRVEASSARSHT